MTNAAPVLPAYRVRDRGYVWCTDCSAWHMHGAESGHRVCHCRDGVRSRYLDPGYVLALQSETPPEIRDAIRHDRPPPGADT